MKALVMVLGTSMLSVGGYAAEELTVYTALEAEDLKKYATRFNQKHPEIKINWVRDSTGITTAKLIAEKENPRADVVLGLAATSLLVLKKQNMLQPYSPKGVEKLKTSFVDADSTPSWVGMNAWVASICFNTIEAKKHNIPKPTSWSDLLDPVYQGQVIMPNPNSSGTGFLDVSSWQQLFGEELGWAYMDALHNNISRYTHSGSKPCKLAASGETVIGISFAFRGARLKEKGAPIDLIFPEEGLGWDMEAAAIVKGTKNLSAAKTLMDWVVTREANELYNEGFAVVAMPGVAKPIKYYPQNIDELMIENNFEWAAKNRTTILAMWQKRFDGKSEAR